jgi:hypothetical protein
MLRHYTVIFSDYNIFISKLSENFKFKFFYYIINYVYILIKIKMSETLSQTSSKKRNLRPKPLDPEEIPIPETKAKLSSKKSQPSEHKENKPDNGFPKMVEEEATEETVQNFEQTQSILTVEEAKNEEVSIPIEDTSLLKPSSQDGETAEIVNSKKTASVTKSNVSTCRLIISKSRSKSRSRSKTSKKLSKVKEAAEKKEEETVEKKENEMIDVPEKDNGVVALQEKENDVIAECSEKDNTAEDKEKAAEKESGNDEKATESEPNI